MFDIPDSLRALFTGTVRRREGSYVVEIPAHEVESGGVDVGDRYRVALVEAPEWAAETDETGAASHVQTRSAPHQRGPNHTEHAASDQPPEPPVEEGEIRQVEIESVGDQGDGIAKVERGFVVIVPDARPGEHPRVEIENVKQNVAFASIVDARR